MPNTKKRTDSLSKATIIRMRERRISALYQLRGYRPPEIVDILIEEDLHCGAQRDSLLRMVQERVKSLRENAEPSTILAMQRPAESERYRQQLYKIAREELSVIENEDEVSRQVASPRGDVITVNEPRYSADDKQKARKNYVAVVEKLALLSGVDVKGEAVSEAEKDAPKTHASSAPFQIVMTGKPMDELIALNVDQAKVN